MAKWGAVRGRKMLSAAYTASEDSLMKERARFVAEFLTAAQLGPGGGLQKKIPLLVRDYIHVASKRRLRLA